MSSVLVVFITVLVADSLRVQLELDDRMQAPAPGLGIGIGLGLGLLAGASPAASDSSPGRARRCGSSGATTARC